MDLDDLRPETTATRVYAVGDLHGRLDLLTHLEAAIRDDLERPRLVTFDVTG